MMRSVKKNNPSPANRGFVLSFAVLIVSLFILIYAQLQAEHSYGLRAGETMVWQAALPLRFAADARMDLNLLLDERVRVDHNGTHSQTWVSASLPSPLSLSTMLTRYAADLNALAQDYNLTATLDATSATSDGNITARLTNGWEWKRNLATSIAIFRPREEAFIPIQYDINLTASLPYSSRTAWSLDESGDIYITLRYTDQNTSHTFTDSGWITAGAAAKQYTWIFGNGASQFTLSAGRLNRIDGSLYLDNNRTSTLDIDYIVHAVQNDPGFVQAGYEIPLTVIGPDGNVAMDRQWLQN